MQMILPHNFENSAKENYLVRESASRALFKPGRLVTLKCFLYRRKVFIWRRMRYEWEDCNIFLNRFEQVSKLFVPGADRDQHQVFQTLPPHCLHCLFDTAWIGLSD